MSTSESMGKYRRLQEQLIWMRWKSQGQEDPEEECLLEKMTEAWGHLDEEEQLTIRKEGPKTIVAPTNPSHVQHEQSESLDDMGQGRHYTEVA